MIKEIISEEKNIYKITQIDSEKEAIANVKEGKYVSAFIIGSDFSNSLIKGEKPKIELIKTESENIAFKLSQDIDEYVNKILVLTGLKQKLGNINENYIKQNPIIVNNRSGEGTFNYAGLMLAFIINFIIFSANQVSQDISMQRKQNTLTRQFSTPHKPWEISGGLILGFAFTQIVVYTVITLALKMIFNLNYGTNYLNVFMGMTAMIIFSVSIGLFVIRLTSNEGLLSIIVSITGTGMGFISGSFTNNVLPEGIKGFSKFTPQYWFMDILNGGNPIVNSLIIVLMAMVFFTAGSIKFARFARE